MCPVKCRIANRSIAVRDRGSTILPAFGKVVAQFNSAIPRERRSVGCRPQSGLEHRVVFHLERDSRITLEDGYHRAELSKVHAKTQTNFARPVALDPHLAKPTNNASGTSEPPETIGGTLHLAPPLHARFRQFAAQAQISVLLQPDFLVDPSVFVLS